MTYDGDGPPEQVRSLGVAGESKLAQVGDFLALGFRGEFQKHGVTTGDLVHGDSELAPSLVTGGRIHGNGADFFAVVVGIAQPDLDLTGDLPLLELDLKLSLLPGLWLAEIEVFITHHTTVAVALDRTRVPVDFRDITPAAKHAGN